MQTGLVSITFRQLDVAEIVALVSNAGLQAIEWGGDVHVPHGDIEKAKRVREMTQAAGLETAAYGSYYRIGEANSPEFSEVLATAVVLGTDKIRVWVGSKGSDVAADDYRRNVIDDAKRICDLAAKENAKIVSEWHGNTLMDELSSALRFIDEVGRDNFKTYWQPLVDRSVEVCLREIEALIPHLTGIHVFAWSGTQRLMLAEHRDRWQQYFARAKPAGDIPALLEFVQDDSPEAFELDAAILKDIILVNRK